MAPLILDLGTNIGDWWLIRHGRPNPRKRTAGTTSWNRRLGEAHSWSGRFGEDKISCPYPESKHDSSGNKTVIGENRCRIRHEISRPLHINSRDVPHITFVHRDANSPCPYTAAPITCHHTDPVTILVLPLSSHYTDPVIIPHSPYHTIKQTTLSRS